MGDAAIVNQNHCIVLGLIELDIRCGDGLNKILTGLTVSNGGVEPKHLSNLLSMEVEEWERKIECSLLEL